MGRYVGMGLIVVHYQMKTLHRISNFLSFSLVSDSGIKENSIDDKSNNFA